MLIVAIVLESGFYIYNKYDLKSHFVVDAKTIQPIGEINFSFNDSFRDAWNKSTTYAYKALILHGYDLCLMSELPKNKGLLNHRIYLEQETENTLIQIGGKTFIKNAMQSLFNKAQKLSDKDIEELPLPSLRMVNAAIGVLTEDISKDEDLYSQSSSSLSTKPNL